MTYNSKEVKFLLFSNCNHFLASYNTAIELEAHLIVS